MSRRVVPPSFQAARTAREPLSQFLVGQAGVGLVSGHRLPNREGREGRPVNQAALDLMAQGLSPEEAVEKTLAANPELDAGLVAVGRNGRWPAAIPPA